MHLDTSGLMFGISRPVCPLDLFLFRLIPLLTECEQTGSGCINAIFPPTTPPRVASPELLIKEMKSLTCDVAITFPSFLQSWVTMMEAGKDDGSMQKVLKELKALVSDFI